MSLPAADPIAADLRDHFKGRRRTWDFDFGFETADRLAKPRAFASLTGLCRHIQGLRRGGCIQLENRRYVLSKDRTLRVVAVYSMGPEGGAGAADRFLGYAYLMGRDREALASALYLYAPSTTRRVEPA